MNTRCTATTKTDRTCKAWAVAGTDPPRCVAHGGRKKPAGTPKQGQAAQPPQTIEDVFHGLADRQAELEGLIAAQDDLDLKEIVRLIALYAQNASRLARIYRDMAKMGDQEQDEIDRAIGEILTEMGLS